MTKCLTPTSKYSLMPVNIFSGVPTVMPPTRYRKYSIITIVAISIFAYNTYEQSVLQQKKLVNALLDASASLINSGNYTGAIKNLDKALDIDPNNKNALTNKGRALNDLGNQNEAIKYIDKGLAIDPNYVPALEIKGSMLYDLGNYTQAIQYIDKALSLGAWLCIQ